MFRATLLAFASITLLSTAYASSFKGSIKFSRSEKRKHASKAEDLSKYSAACLERYKRSHKSFYQNNCRYDRKYGKICISKYYGDRKYSKTKGAKRAEDGRELKYLGDELAKLGFSRSLMNQMENISCVGMTLNCLEEGFVKTRQGKIWNRILSYVKMNAVSGTALQSALRKLGWKVLYWNPEPHSRLREAAKSWDKEEKDGNNGRGWQSKGWHDYRYAKMKSTHKYWNNEVDDKSSLVGFMDSTPEYIHDIPFWVGTAHTGYHVFPGTRSQIIEAHSVRKITDHTTVEWGEFNPYPQRYGGKGAPVWSKDEKYRSGLIAVPPGF